MTEDLKSILNKKMATWFEEGDTQVGRESFMNGWNFCATFLMDYLEKQGWVSGEELEKQIHSIKAEWQKNTNIWDGKTREVQSQLSEAQKRIKELEEEIVGLNAAYDELAKSHTKLMREKY